MFAGKLRYLLGILLISIIIVLVFVSSGKLFLKPQPETTPSPVEGERYLTFEPQEIVGTVKSLGDEEEFSIEKEGEIVFENKATDLPKIRYRISSPGKVVSAQWKDLKLGDKVVLTISYDAGGQIESQILRMYRE